MRTSRVALAALLALAPLAACGDDDDDATATTGTTEAADPIVIDGAWARTTPAGTDRSAAYLTVTAAEDDALVAASADPAVAGRVELHETVAAGGGMGDPSTTMAGGMGGEMTMRPVERIALPAGEPVALEPGGLHVMLLDLPRPLTAGTTFALTLRFEVAGERTVELTVSDDAP